MDNNGFNEIQDLSHPPSEVSNRGYSLSDLQRGIHRNLGYIGSEIAAFYLDALKILHNNNLETSSASTLSLW